MRTAIIGAGLTGLTAARALAQAGLAAVVFDKGRGLGGRMATRRAEGGLQFDHGAQYLAAKTPGFQAFLDEAEAAGAAAHWTLEDGRTGLVGTPGMRGVAGHLAAGLDIRQTVEIEALGAAPGGWTLAGETFDRIILTVPAPQARRLLGPTHSLDEALAEVEMTPNLTLMLALPGTAPRPFPARRDAHGDIAWLAEDSAKPGRPDAAACWVAQAGLAWSEAHLELEKDQIAARLAPLACDLIGADPGEALYMAGHRWRYADTRRPLGQPFLAQGTLLVGGDWTGPDRAESAWQSGMAMAEAVLASR